MMTGEGGVFRGEVLWEHLQSWGAQGIGGYCEEEVCGICRMQGHG